MSAHAFSLHVKVNFWLRNLSAYTSIAKQLSYMLLWPTKLEVLLFYVLGPQRVPSSMILGCMWVHVYFVWRLPRLCCTSGATKGVGNLLIKGSNAATQGLR